MSTLFSHNPATGEVLGEVTIFSKTEVEASVARAKRASVVWAALPFAERKIHLLRFRDQILMHMDALAELISKENGKPIVEAIGNDIVPAMDFVDHFAKHTEKLLRNEKLRLGKWSLMGRKSHLEFYPYGVVGIMAPWNFPFSIPVGQIVMALMAGNTVVFKPSEFTPLVGLKIGELFAKAGLPSGVVEVVSGDGATGAVLVESAVDKISFTGSVATGKKIMAVCANTLKPLTLELGGKDPMLVFADTDLDVASSAAVWGAFCNSGQVCASVERVYVQAAIAKEFTDAVVAKTKKLRQGQGQSLDVDLGAMTAQMQIDKVSAQVEDARKRGAEILTGGQAHGSPGLFYAPTVITGVDHSFEVVREETFGPVMPIMSFQTEDEAVRLANDSMYALNAYIWTKDMAKAKRVASRLVAGTVNINESVFSFAVPQTPWGGPKLSGIGHTHGILGLLDLVQVRHVHRNMMPRKRNFFWWYGYSPDKVAMLKTLAMVLFGKGFVRIKALGKFIVMSIKAKVQ